MHNRFFEVNLYQKSAINTHHWRATLSRPSRDIGLSFRQKRCEPLPSTSHRETLTLPARHEVAERENEDRLSDCNEGSSSQLDVITLKNYLRFLLPSIGTSLGSGRILSLLTLDWINKELALGLDFEARWDTELNVSNISAFLCDWLEMSAGEIVFASKIEGLVIPAIRHVELLGGHQIPGRDRLQGIVDHILNRNPSVDWVSNAEQLVDGLLCVRQWSLKLRLQFVKQRNDNAISVNLGLAMTCLLANEHELFHLPSSTCQSPKLHAPSIVCNIIRSPVLNDYDVSTSFSKASPGSIYRLSDGRLIAKFKPVTQAVRLFQVRLSGPAVGSKFGSIHEIPTSGGMAGQRKKEA
ncbi:hypothetical protein LZL87_013819 [Fusarium oxysporum]|nr:hypothetical protein LZL87_013819 [Fusarium oxysporum]